MPSTPPMKSKPERLQPLVTTKSSQLNDQSLVNDHFIRFEEERLYSGG